jgi:F0F1-type ATP synthase membrane subunit b/b'
MIGAGTIISPIIKVVTTVAILAAIYFFFVKPTLDTTENISNSVSQSINDSFDSFAPDVQRSVKEARKLQDQAAAQTSSAQVQSANKLLSCISNAEGDVNKISACQQKFTP